MRLAGGTSHVQWILFTIKQHSDPFPEGGGAAALTAIRLLPRGDIHEFIEDFLIPDDQLLLMVSECTERLKASQEIFRFPPQSSGTQTPVPL